MSKPESIIDPTGRKQYLCPECGMYSHLINSRGGRCLDCREREIRNRVAKELEEATN